MWAPGFPKVRREQSPTREELSQICLWGEEPDQGSHRGLQRPRASGKNKAEAACLRSSHSDPTSTFTISVLSINAVSCRRARGWGGASLWELLPGNMETILTAGESSLKAFVSVSKLLT